MGSGAVVYFANVNFGACAAAHLIANAAQIVPTGSYTISGSAPYHALATYQGAVDFISTITVTLTGTPAFTAFARAVYAGFIACSNANVTFSGSATGSHYFVADVSFIGTAGSGSTFFPGSTAGSAANSWNYA